MKQIFALLVGCLVLAVGVYIGELRMQVQTYEHNEPSDRAQTILDEATSYVIEFDSNGLIKGL